MTYVDLVHKDAKLTEIALELQMKVCMSDWTLKGNVLVSDKNAASFYTADPADWNMLSVHLNSPSVSHAGLKTLLRTFVEEYIALHLQLH